MSVSNLLYLLEQISKLYDRQEIARDSDTFTPEFLSLIGEIKDVLSNCRGVSKMRIFERAK